MSEVRSEMVMSPNGKEFQAFSSDTRGAIGDLKNWSGKRIGAAAQQPAPALLR